MTKKITKAYNLFLVYSVLKGVGGNLFILLQFIKQFRFLKILHNFSLFCFSGFGEQVDLECSDGRNAVGIFSHRRLSV